MKKMVQLSGFFAVMLVVTMVLVAGCTQKIEGDGDGPRIYVQDDLESYLVEAESPIEISHWFAINHQKPGLFHLFYQGDLYIMATYSSIDYLDMEIEEVKIEDEKIEISAVGGESVLIEGTADEVDSYYSNVYVIKDVEPASGGYLNSEPYKLILER